MAQGAFRALGTNGAGRALRRPTGRSPRSPWRGGPGHRRTGTGRRPSEQRGWGRARRRVTPAGHGSWARRVQGVGEGERGGMRLERAWERRGRSERHGQGACSKCGRRRTAVVGRRCEAAAGRASSQQRLTASDDLGQEREDAGELGRGHGGGSGDREERGGAVSFCTGRGRGEAEAGGLTDVAGVRGGEAR